MRVETEPWWRQARADLETAEVLFQARRSYAASWFVQQAVEKGLKALYVERRGVLAPRTHDLRYLGREIVVPAAVETDLVTLNPTFDLTRYPDPSHGTVPVDEVTEDDATRDLEAGRRVFGWLERQLNPRTP
jgi:HEPN domain-containing protein